MHVIELQVSNAAPIYKLLVASETSPINCPQLAIAREVLAAGSNVLLLLT